LALREGELNLKKQEIEIRALELNNLFKEKELQDREKTG
jgi:hypothetical protein